VRFGKEKKEKNKHDRGHALRQSVQETVKGSLGARPGKGALPKKTVEREHSKGPGGNQKSPTLCAKKGQGAKPAAAGGNKKISERFHASIKKKGTRETLLREKEKNDLQNQISKGRGEKKEIFVKVGAQPPL